MKTNWFTYGLVVFLLAISCQKKNEAEPNLVGGWTDQTIIYHFKTDKTYGQKYLLNGSGKDTVVVDSAFGDYAIDKNKKIITFNQKGYYDKKKNLVPEIKNGTTWQYDLSGNTLKYYSSTSIGELTRIY